MRKCSYFIRTASGGAPGFKLYDVEPGVSQTYRPTGNRLYLFDLHYIEFADSEITMLPTSAWSGSTIAEGTFPAVTDPLNAEINQLNKMPSDFYAGANDVFYDYTTPSGRTYTEHKHVLEARYARYEELYEHYEETVEDYDVLKNAYNAVIQDYNEQVAAIEEDSFAAFTAGTVATLGDLPDRPCPPTRPPEYTGVFAFPDPNGFDGEFGTQATWNNENTLKAGFVDQLQVLRNKAQLGTWNDESDFNAGAGHMFGLLGNGNATEPMDGAAWAPADPAGEAHTIIVSVFPNSQAPFQGLADNTITIEAGMYVWGEHGAGLNPVPVRPEGAAQPLTVGAINLALGALAASTIVSYI